MTDTNGRGLSRRDILRTSAGLGASAALAGLLPSLARAQDKTLNMWWWGEQELPGIQKYLDTAIAAFPDAKISPMCGCPIEPGGLWNAGGYTVEAFVLKGDKVVSRTAMAYGVMSIPTLILFKNGQAVARVNGFQPKDKIKAQLAAHL